MTALGDALTRALVGVGLHNQIFISSQLTWNSPPQIGLLLPFCLVS
jgi:hypothetical protein